MVHLSAGLSDPMSERSDRTPPRAALSVPGSLVQVLSLRAVTVWVGLIGSRYNLLLEVTRCCR